MKSISNEMKEHLGQELTTLAELVKITRTDGQVVAFTSHDRDLVMDGVTYKADGAFTAEKLLQETAMKTKDYDVSGFLDSAAISEDDLKAGLYDHAAVEVRLCNWADPSQGSVMLRRGWLGEVVFSEGRYMASLRGLHDLMTRKVGKTYTPECRYDLGDGCCGVNVAALTITGIVTALISERQFTDATLGEVSGTFNNGKLTWLSGANAGTQAEVCAWDYDTQSLTLWLPPVHPVQIGDTYSLTPGCDKRFSTCRARFGNGENYGGFPYLPGIGKVLQYPD